MECPKCLSRMAAISLGGYEVDRCTACKGLWFDNMESEELKLVDNSEMIDSGDAATGRKFNPVKKAACPRCKVPMGKLVPPEQSDIWYEGCPRCRGIFFDAGEFRSYLQNNTVLSFKNLRPAGA